MRGAYFALLLTLVLVAGAAVGILNNDEYRPTIVNFIKWMDLDPTAANNHRLLALLTGDVSTPGPLKWRQDGVSGILTSAGVLLETNERRLAAGLPSLKSNAMLDAAAKVKLEDMLARQYFDHASPDGAGPAQVIEKTGYEYIRVGENLALGNFIDDNALVQAWMDSPGHRANILSENFSELGVAVTKGVYEGTETWLAVQSFGLPTDTCPEPDEGLVHSYEQKNSSAQDAVQDLAARRSEYEEKITQANSLTEEANKLFKESNSKMAEGNKLIETGNTLVKRGKVEEAKQYFDQGKAWQEEAERLRQEAESKLASAREAGEKATSLQLHYNQLVEQLNTGQQELELLANTLNSQIKAFNACAEKYITE